MNAIAPVLTAGTPYSERRLQAALRMAPRVALTTADLYVAGVTTLGIPAASTFGTSSFLGAHLQSTAAAAGSALPFVNGALAVGHGISGLVHLFSDSDYNATANFVKAKKLAGVGELITAAGFAGQAFGFGPWALPITLIGLGTSVAGQAMMARSE